jgi:predicted nucleotidyltransferase
MGIKIPNMGTPAKRSSRSPRRRKQPTIERTGTSLPDALFTATQQRVLVLLFGQPDRSFFATELIHLARIGRGAVQRELRRLVESGLINVSRVGNQKHYQANRSSPVFKELRSLIRKTVGLHEPIREALKPLSDRISLAALYGSVAKHRDTAMSDIDLLVVSDALTLEELYAALGSAEEKLARKINPTLYTSQEFDRRLKTGNAFLKRVLGGKHEVLMRSDRAA